MQAYFGRAKAACLCSYCCNRHLCYDGGRLGRVKIVTLRVSARAKEGKREGGGEKKKHPTPLLLTRPIFSPLFEFQHALSRANIRAPEENVCTEGYLILCVLISLARRWFRKNEKKNKTTAAYRVGVPILNCPCKWLATGTHHLMGSC